MSTRSLNTISLNETLEDIEEMPYTDVAAVLKIPVDTVKTRLARARDHLRRKLRSAA